MMDEKLGNLLADIEDVAAGHIVDMEHAELMAPLTEACADLETQLETFYETTARDSIINRMTVDELNELIVLMKKMADSIRSLKKSAID